MVPSSIDRTGDLVHVLGRVDELGPLDTVCLRDAPLLVVEEDLVQLHLRRLNHRLIVGEAPFVILLGV